MKTGFFITGTGTNVGKTWVTIALMRYFQRQGLMTVGMKPVASGCEWREGRWENLDALLLQQNASFPLAYELVNPYAFELPISPHLACNNVVVDLQKINATFLALKNRADVVLVEGAGGWLSPLSNMLDNARLAINLQLPVVVVVGITLGCINHARLTIQSVKCSGVKCVGWIAAEIESGRTDYQGTLDYLMNCLDVPFLGELPYVFNIDLAVLPEGSGLKFKNILM